MTGPVSCWLSAGRDVVPQSPHSKPRPELLPLGGCVQAALPSPSDLLQLLPPSRHAGRTDLRLPDHGQLLLPRDPGGPWEGSAARYFLLSSKLEFLMKQTCHLVILATFQGGILLLHYNIWWPFSIFWKMLFYTDLEIWHISDHRPPVKCKTNYLKLSLQHSSVNYLLYS